MAKKDFNVIVIGAGSAGLVSSYIAAAVKAKVALIEKHKMGGDCLNTGCVPSKALIRSAKILSYIKRHKDYGIKSAQATFDFAEIMERVQKVIKKVEPHDSVERFTSLGVDCITGDAKILSPHEVSVNGKTLTTNTIIIATGARPTVPKITGMDKVPYLTSDNLWELRELPKRLIVAGGGPIGSELAQCFARLGSKVTQVEMLPDIMSREDDEISQAIRKRFIEEGIDVRVNSKCKEIVVENGKQFMLIEKNGTTEKIEFDKILVAVGRAANTGGFGLEEIGVKLNQRGTIEVDEYLRTTTHKNIYACGDVAGPYQFTHTAAHQAWYCAVNALFSPFKKFKVDYRVIPWCTFTDPEVAQVGLNEKAAKEKGIPYEVTRYGIDDLDRAIADSEDHGIVKILTEPGKDKILGVTIMGYHAGDLIAEYVLAMKHGLGLNKILGTIHIYPTMAEANKFAAGNWKKAHAPEGLLKLIQKFHSWRR
ncbi:MAG: dihydrolipoyl dehydrogenase [Nitrospinae bacterium]|nr:dihydrolipoyl dehydrogenase [Nitrospinota bacterium]